MLILADILSTGWRFILIGKIVFYYKNYIACIIIFIGKRTVPYVIILTYELTEIIIIVTYLVLVVKRNACYVTVIVIRVGCAFTLYAVYRVSIFRYETVRIPFIVVYRLVYTVLIFSALLKG